MNVTAEMTYPGATVADVMALVLDREFRAAVCRATLALSQDVTVEKGADGSVVVTVDRTMPADVPDFIRTFVGQTIRLVQQESWHRGDESRRRTAELELRIVGQPATMTGTITVTAGVDGARELVTGDLRVGVPFIGRKIEAEVAKGIVAAARKEQETGREWLAR